MYIPAASDLDTEQSGLSLDDCPSNGWDNQQENIYAKCPVVTVASILKYMRPATGVSSVQAAAFRSLTEGHTVWRSGHVLDIWLNATEAFRKWLKFKVLATMKKQVHDVVIAFDRDGHNICFAHCTCAAGLSHSCIHIPAALWCLESFGSRLSSTSKPCLDTS